VLGFAPAEIAETLGASPAAVYSALQRAHQAVDERLPPRSQQATLRTIGDARLRDVVGRYVAAWEEGDVAALVAMLAEDAAFAMPPQATWYRGRAAIASFLADRPMAAGRRWRMTPVTANGQPAFGVHAWDRAAGRWAAHAIEVLTLDDAGRIAEVIAFREPGAFARFGLPAD
jgi:RNA polymerase sigma-70 factor (ECF subfamily)